ncbi:helix-turn-helix domain-containing protein [Paenibacillus validus]|uniref:helix-turn-helix domain-containing protein n=1 Tax=Paenibacillus validus TaxID=44253 RepID=UPI003D2CC781
MKYGDRIAILREKSALTQEELANKLGISRASLSHYENNRREPDFNTTLKIANFFQVSTDYLIGRADIPDLMLTEEKISLRMEDF